MYVLTEKESRLLMVCLQEENQLVIRLRNDAPAEHLQVLRDSIDRLIRQQDEPAVARQ